MSLFHSSWFLFPTPCLFGQVRFHLELFDRLIVSCLTIHHLIIFNRLTVLCAFFSSFRPFSVKMTEMSISFGMSTLVASVFVSTMEVLRHRAGTGSYGNRVLICRSFLRSRLDRHATNAFGLLSVAVVSCFILCLTSYHRLLSDRRWVPFYGPSYSFSRGCWWKGL